jgi:hypothetical protein
MRGEQIPIRPNTGTHIQYLNTLINDAPSEISKFRANARCRCEAFKLEIENVL